LSSVYIKLQNISVEFVIVPVYVVDFSIFIAVRKKAVVKLSSYVGTAERNRFDLWQKLSIENMCIKKQQANKQVFAVCSFKSLTLL
jgi:hypothetical protein